ncbi:MAG: hypothetical protein VB083_02260 [Aminobacterium sp.]|uniref:hypothetical protein n=1 Tax=Aminobacterium sp. TaxID=1872491 RepID=UPI001BD09092|nr:hypothetical protein [Aminobacterium sp.]MEA4876711.1 hypothetical protein [Aminobacterium sp.]
MDIFSNREIASCIWLVVLIVFAFTWHQSRESALYVIKAALAPKIRIIFIIMIASGVVIILLGSRMPIWKCGYIKDISIWVIFVGITECFGAITNEDNDEYFIDMLKKNFKVVTLFEFFLNTHSYSLINELILLPILTCICIIIVTNQDEKWKVRYGALAVLCFILFWVLMDTFKNFINEYTNINMIDLCISFLIPIILSFQYVPIAYGLAVMTKYETLFIRMSSKEPEDSVITRRHRWKIFKMCRFSCRKISIFEKKYVCKMYRGMSDSDFDSLVNKFNMLL